MDTNITPLRSYVAHLIPNDVEAEDVEALASAGMLERLHLRASSCEQAAHDAALASGKAVHRVERLERLDAQEGGQP